MQKGARAFALERYGLLIQTARLSTPSRLARQAESCDATRATRALDVTPLAGVGKAYSYKEKARAKLDSRGALGEIVARLESGCFAFTPGAHAHGAQTHHA